MAALDGQNLVPEPSVSVAMEVQTAQLEQDNSSSQHCINGAVVFTGPSPNGVELGSVLDQKPDYMLQLQDSTAAATGECGVSGADCWAQFGAGRDRRSGDKEAERDLGQALDSESAEGGGNGGELPFSKQLITFSLFGKMPAKSS